MYYSGHTTQGMPFEVMTVEDEIIYLDNTTGQTLTWDDNEVNEKLVEDMVVYITSHVLELAA